MESATVNPLSLADRVERLERQNRLWKGAALALLLLPATLVVMGQASSNRTLTAQKLVITDASGKPRATLAAGAYGAMLSFTNADGKLRADFGIDAYGPGLTFDDTEQAKTAGLGVGALVFTADGGLRTTLGSNTGGGLTLYGADGKPDTVLDSPADGPFLRIRDAEGYQAIIGSTDLLNKATGETHKTSAAAVTLFDKQGKLIWKVP